MAVWGVPGRDPAFQRMFWGIGFARWAALAAVFLVTGPPMTNFDDFAGRALGTRWSFLERVQGLDGPTSTVTVTAAPGTPLEITTTGSDTTCAVRDGTTWTPLDRIDEFAGYDVGVGYREGRRGGPHLRTDRLTRIHRFITIDDRTELNCEGFSTRPREEVWRTDRLPLLGYQAVVIGGRILWVAALTSIVWVPLWLRRRRRLRAEADEARRSELPYRTG